MGLLSKIGIGSGGAILLSGLLLHGAEQTASPPVPLRVYNIIRNVGFALPIPDEPLLIHPTLAILNLPVWAMLAVAGACLLGLSWLTRGRPAH